MPIEQQIQTDIISAMKSGDKAKTEALRYVKSVLKNEQIKKGQNLTDEEVIKVLQKEVAKRQEAVTFALKANRADAAKANKNEINILSAYLPAELSDIDLRHAIEEIIAQNKDLPRGPLTGKIMGTLKGQASGKRIVSLLEDILFKSNI